MIGYYVIVSINYPPPFVASIDLKIGEHIKTRRKNLGLNQTTVVVQMDTAYGFKWLQSHLSKVEAGDRLLKLSEAFALAGILNIDLFDLARGESLDKNTEPRLVLPELPLPGGFDGVDN